MADIASALKRALDSGLADRARELLATRKKGAVGTQREVDAIYALRHAASWIGSASHGDNCFVSNHYEGDPGNRCNCGKDSAEQAINEALGGYPEAMDADGEPLELSAADGAGGARPWRHSVGEQLRRLDELATPTPNAVLGRDGVVRVEAPADGVGTSVPVGRPATMEEAQHAAQIGACLPNGVLFDAYGNPRVRHIRVIFDGSTCVVSTDAEAEQYRLNDPEGTYEFKDVYLSKEEFDALPEFDGF